MLYTGRSAVPSLSSYTLPSHPSPGPELITATFTLRTQPLPSLPRVSFTLCNSNGFPNNSPAPHNLLFCVGEDLWDCEVYTSKQFQHTWKWLCRGQKSDKQGAILRGKPASHSVFPMLKSSQFGNTVFLNLQMSTIMLKYMMHLNIFPRSQHRILLMLDWTQQV